MKLWAYLMELDAPVAGETQLFRTFHWALWIIGAFVL
jgi:hypothetical protein